MYSLHLLLFHRWVYWGLQAWDILPNFIQLEAELELESNLVPQPLYQYHLDNTIEKKLYDLIICGKSLDFIAQAQHAVVCIIHLVDSRRFLVKPVKADTCK